mgnify:CR=1 FL=1
MNKNLKLLLVLIVIVAAGYFGYNYIMTGGERNLEKEKSEFVISATNIFEEFSVNSENASSKYVNKAVEISGTISSSNKNEIILDGKVSCQLSIPENIAVGSQVKIKGRVTGYDDLLEELKLDQCLIVK